MSLEDKIKKAFRKDKLLREASTKWNSEDHPNIYELENFLKKSGYKLLDIIIHKGVNKSELVIESIVKDYLYPEIVHEMTDNKFYVEITKSKLVSQVDLEKVVLGYENALAILKYLNNLDLNKLEIEYGDN